MNFGPMVTAIFLVNLIAPAYALSLKLSPEVDLLVVDGRQVSGPILKGADSLELDAGKHQILFQISKKFPGYDAATSVYRSPPIIVAFDAKNLQSVGITLPSLKNMQEGIDFSKKMNISLVDEKGNSVAYRQGKLADKTFTNAQNFESTMTEYNLSGQTASVPEFALTKKSSMTLNANNSGSDGEHTAENVSKQQAFWLWSLLNKSQSSGITAMWLTIQ